MDRRSQSIGEVTASRHRDVMGRVGRLVPPLVGLALFAAALWVLNRELYATTFAGLAGSIARLPRSRAALAIGLTILNYAVLTFHDQLAFVYVGRRIPRRRIALASFVGYAISNSVGFALVSGTSARYRFYSRWGLSLQELSRVVAFYAGTFWLGLLVLGGWSLIVSPPPGLQAVPGYEWAPRLGALLLAVAVGYAVAAFARRSPVRIGALTFAMPARPLVVAQFVLSTADWALAVAVLHALMPDPRPAFAPMISAFLVAQLLGLASHVPGGVGVFESLMVVLLKPAVSAPQLLPALVLFRAIYYLLPLAVALLVLVADELYHRRHQVARWQGAFGSMAGVLAPRLLAVFTFVAGAILLFSGATPAAAGRLARLAPLVSLPVLEVSHLLGSLIGVALLIVSQGIARRLDAAYYLAAGGLAAGIVTSLAKGGDYEEALVLAALLAVLLPARREFDRKAALFDLPPSPAWLAAVAAVLIGSIWVGLFSYQHVEYANELWWRFELDQEASRFLRASLGVLIVAAVVALRWLLRPAPPLLSPPSEEELAAAEPVIASQTSTSPYLVYLRDKAILWNEDRTGFVMYAIHGRTWVALHDPVGPPEVRAGLIRRFLERCDDFGGIPVFYEVQKDGLHRYADFGLAFAKLGEEARVDLRRFSLEGAEHKSLRGIARRASREGARFRIIPPSEVRPLLPVLREISDEWLAGRATAEKRFSLGFFDPDYLCRFPIGVLEQAGDTQAFINIWMGPGSLELSLDLMRHRRSAPKNVMDALLINLMVWGKEQGYQWCNLGMAPLSGLESSELAPLWPRFGGFVYRHGEAFYHFQGLREFKEKYKPVWEPRYLVSPGGLSLPKVLADVSALTSGGYRGILFRRERTRSAARVRVPQPAPRRDALVNVE